MHILCSEDKSSATVVSENKRSIVPRQRDVLQILQLSGIVHAQHEYFR